MKFQAITNFTYMWMRHEAVGSSRLQHYTAPELFIQWLNPVSTKHTRGDGIFVPVEILLHAFQHCLKYVPKHLTGTRLVHRVHQITSNNCSIKLWVEWPSTRERNNDPFQTKQHPPLLNQHWYNKNRWIESKVLISSLSLSLNCGRDNDH